MTHGKMVVLTLCALLSAVPDALCGAGRIASLAHGGESYSYGYDSGGRINYAAGANAQHSWQTSYGYDAAGRLGLERRSGWGAYQNGYTYDHNGNRTQVATRNPGTVGVPHSLDFSGTSLPSQATVISGTWAVADEQLSGTGTPAVGRLALNLGSGNTGPYTATVQPDTSNLGAGQETLAGIVLDAGTSGRYLAVLSVQNNSGLQYAVKLCWIATPATGQPEVVTVLAASVYATYTPGWYTLSLTMQNGSATVTVSGNGVDGMDATADLPGNVALSGLYGLETRTTGTSAAQAAFSSFTYEVDSGQTSQSSAFNANNQMKGCAYDAAGRLKSQVVNGVAIQYQYDIYDRVVGAAAADGLMTASYTYAGPSSFRTSATVNGVTTYYTYDGAACIGESGAAQKDYFVPGGSPLGESVNGQLSAVYGQDGQGNVTALYNQSGACTAQFSYDAYGNASAYDGAGVTQTALTGGPRWKGQMFDPPSGNYVMGWRHYSPQMGRFTARDPIGYAGGMNVYGYCGGDPVNRSDPSGLEWELIADGLWRWKAPPDVPRELPKGATDWQHTPSAYYAFRERSDMKAWFQANPSGLDARLEREKYSAMHPGSPTPQVPAQPNRSGGGMSLNFSWDRFNSNLDVARDLTGVPGKNASTWEWVKWTALGVLGAGGAAERTVGNAEKFIVGAEKAERVVAGAERAATAAERLAAMGEKSFPSFDALKDALGAAGKDQNWHHIVEQSQEGRFGSALINNTKNIIPVSSQINSKLNGLYSSIRPDITGSATLKVRDWLSTQSFEAARDFGLRALENVSNGKWP